jgi:hypothetical protein
MSGWVWLFLIFGLVMVVVGAVIGFYGARMFPPASPATSTEIGPGAAHGAAPYPASSVPAQPSTSVAAPVASADPSALASRLDKLESGRKGLGDAATAALAAASLSQAAETGRPFLNELNAVAQLMPDSRAVDALRPFADKGAPSRAVLVAEFPEMARRADFAANTPGAHAGLLARLTHALSVLFTVRQVDRLTGNDPDAILARAERKVNDGDLEGAVKELDSLPPKGREAASVWRERALQRVQIQSRVSTIRLNALRNLAGANSGVAQ